MIAVSIQCDICSDRKTIEKFEGVGFTADGYLMNDPVHASTCKHLCKNCVSLIVNHTSEEFVSSPIARIGSEP